MKKRSIFVLLLTTLTIGSAIPATAAPYCCGRSPQCGQNYVDANGDGICDNFVDNDGDGINDNCPGNGQGQKRGQNYVDANGDGICDNFVDNDGDGINDNCPGNGQGQKRGQYKAPASNLTKNNAAKKNTIEKVQRKLCKLGYRCGEINGVMNADTKNALKKFKKTNGLKANAVINKATLKALKIS